MRITVKKNPNRSVEAYNSLEGEDRKKWLERIAKAILSVRDDMKTESTDTEAKSDN